MGVLISVALAFYAAYMAVMIMLFGVPSSISDCFYLLNGRRNGLGYVFTAWCRVMAVLVMIPVFGLSAGRWYQCLGLFAGGGLGFVGAAPMFKGHERTVHYVSAGVCAAASIAWMTAGGYWYVPIVALAVSEGIARLWGNRVFWLENACFSAMFGVLQMMSYELYI